VAFVMIAALFVETGGVYFGLDGVDPYDARRDATTYEGPYPVIAHPPCARWGRYWSGGPSARVRRKLGDDNGYFEFALNAVRTFSGILEHPGYSHAWRYFGLYRPPLAGGWIIADALGGWTCHVEQGHYGHRARKATWLYAHGCLRLPELIWGPCSARVRLDPGFHSAEERRMFMHPPRDMTAEWRKKRRMWMAKYTRLSGKLSKRERLATPIPFRDLLIDIAKGAQRK